MDVRAAAAWSPEPATMTGRRKFGVASCAASMSMSKPKPRPIEGSPVVVTPRMIEAGAATLAQWQNGSAYDLAAAVYRAMAEGAPMRKSAPPLSEATFLEVLRVLGHGPPKS